MTGRGGPGPDRSGLLVVFGVVEILIGALCAGLLCLMAAAAVLARRLPPDQAPSLEGSALVASALVYACAAAFFVVMGIGTIRARRWARVIMLIVAWPWLLTMILMGALMMVVARPLAAGLQAQAGGEVPVGIFLALMLFAVFFMALVPLALILFYGGRNVKRVFDTRDPRPCWTDGRPPAVLGLALLMFAGAAGSLAGLHYRVVTLFGWVLTGPPAVVVTVALAVLGAWLGWGLYRMTTAGWWANVLVAVAGHLSWSLTLARVGFDGVLRAMQLDEARLSALRQTGMMAALGSQWIVALSGVAWVALLLAVRRHFRPGGLTAA